MHFAEEQLSGRLAVRAYEQGCVTVGETVYQTSLILTPERVIPDWRPAACEELRQEDFEPILSLHPEVVLLGTGGRLQFPAPALTARLLQAGAGFEVMDTAAACRTYNILLSEDRRVVAALLLP